ncbi:MAG: hypothetical protein ACYSU1_04330 [Planctomycetota bacterium]|jgi:hypothetical protein
MVRPLLFVSIVLALCVGGGLALRTRALPESAHAPRIEEHLAEEIALLHEVAEELVRRDLRFPSWDHEAGHEDYMSRIEAFTAKTDEIKALAGGISHPALHGARVMHKEGPGNRFELWIMGEEELRSTWSISPSRASSGKPSVHRMHGGSQEVVSYSAVGPMHGGSTPAIEILVDLEWLVAHGED